MGEREMLGFYCLQYIKKKKKSYHGNNLNL